MDLALSLKIYKIFQEKVGKPHFGYAIPKPSVWEAIENWVRSILLKEKYIKNDEKQQIKLINPNNPPGRIWSLE